LSDLFKPIKFDIRCLFEKLEASAKRFSSLRILPDVANGVLGRDNEFGRSNPSTSSLKLGDEGHKIGPVFEISSEGDVPAMCYLPWLYLLHVVLANSSEGGVATYSDIGSDLLNKSGLSEIPCSIPSISLSTAKFLRIGW